MVTDQDAMSEEEEKSGGFMPWKIVLAVVVAGIFLWLVFGGEQICTEDGRLCYTIWQMYTFIFVLFIWIVRSGYIEMKYKSPQFVGNNIHASITARPLVSAGKFYLKRLGGIDFGVTIEGREGTVIFPHEAKNNLGSQMAVPARFSLRRLDQLDQLVQEKIRQAGFPAPYWYGDIDESHFYIDPKDLDNMLSKSDERHLNKLMETVGDLKRFNPAQLHLLLRDALENNSKLRKEREILMGSAESVVAFGARIHDKAKHIGGIRRVLPSRKDEEERR